MMMALDIALFAVIAGLCWQGYQKRRLWFVVPLYLWLRLGKGRGFWQQFLIYGPAIVVWLLLCHWVNTHGWHATAAGGMLIAMTIGLQAMRMAEDEQKWNKKQYDTEMEQ